MNAASLERRLSGSPYAGKIHHRETVGSTHDELRRLADDGAPELTTVIAACQTRGRGRHGRRWDSPAGRGLYLSTLRFAEAPSLTRWAIGAAVAAGETCRRETGLPVTLKWPNDLLVADRKLGGCLIEGRSRPDARAQLLIGIGVNVSTRRPEFPLELRRRATSVAIEAGPPAPDLDERLAAGFLEAFQDVAVHLAADDWLAIASRWDRLAPGYRGTRAIVRPAHDRVSSFEGLTRGLAGDGGLRVEKPGGMLVTVYEPDAVRILGE